MTPKKGSGTSVILSESCCSENLDGAPAAGSAARPRSGPARCLCVEALFEPDNLDVMRRESPNRLRDAIASALSALRFARRDYLVALSGGADSVG